ncbi:MAG: phosphoribosylanthranilate isomerase [Bacillota bacterium]
MAVFCGLDTLQFHGEETAAYCRLFHPYKVIKAFPVSPGLSVERCREYRCSAVLLDTKYADKKGGGGRTFDWRLVLPFSKGKFPFILAGGLNRDNVLEALNVLKPFGVDVSSGVEKDGLKDNAVIRAFMDQIRRWEYH